MINTQSVSILAYIVPIFSAFFGASAAFALGLFRERLRDREKRLATVNAAVYGLLMSAATLFNLKKQFLTAFEVEFKTMMQNIGGLSPTADAAEVARISRTVIKLINEISKRDATLNGVFKKWQESEFPMMPLPMELAFTVTGAPDLVRLVHVARIEVSQVSKRIAIRNTLWERKEEDMLKEASEGGAGIKTILLWFEMLDMRTIIRTHVDTALVVMVEALKQLDKYRKAHLRKRNWLLRRLLGKERWTTFIMAKEWEKLVPDKRDYKDVLCLPTENLT